MCEVLGLLPASDHVLVTTEAATGAATILVDQSGQRAMSCDLSRSNTYFRTSIVSLVQSHLPCPFN